MKMQNCKKNEELQQRVNYFVEEAQRNNLNVELTENEKNI